MSAIRLPNFTLYSRREYYDELIERVESSQKGDHINLMSMGFEPQTPTIDRLMHALCHAAARGARVSLAVDAKSFMQAKGALPGPLLTGITLTVISRRPYGQMFRRLEELRVSGGEYFILNRPTRGYTNPYGDRSHIKLALVNDRVYIPSSNLNHDNHLDLVVAWNDLATAAWLRGIYHKIIDTGNVRTALHGIDQSHVINDAMTLLVDSGVKRQSAIYQQAIALIDEAKEHLYMTCQYFPGGHTGQALLQAHKRGVRVEIDFSPPSAHGKQLLGQIAYNQREILRLPPAFFAGRMPRHAHLLHAKLLASESAAMVGSHNYVTQGVTMGTAEIALVVRDADFAKAAEAKIKAEISRFHRPTETKHTQHAK